MNPTRSLSDCFSKEIGPTATKVSENLYALEVDAEELFDDLKRTYREEVTSVRGTKDFWAIQVRGDGLYARFVEEHGKEISEVISDATYVRPSEVERFLNLSLPGVDEAMALLKLFEVAHDEGKGTST